MNFCKIITISMLFIESLNSRGQSLYKDSILKMQYAPEHIYMQLDRYFFMAGDTIWFKGFVFKDDHPSVVSTNLYLELFSDSGHLISEQLFPILNSEFIGQLAIPDSLVSASYWIRAFTRYQTNFDLTGLFMVPVIVRKKQDTAKIKTWVWKQPMKADSDSLVELKADTIAANAEAYNAWLIKIKDPLLYECSVSVTDADRTVPLQSSAGQFLKSRNIYDSFPIKLDSAFLQWTGTATKGYSNKKITNEELAVLIAKDSTILQHRIMQTDSKGHFEINHLFFFDTLSIQFQLNNNYTGNAKNVRLAFETFKPPHFHIPDGWVRRDTSLSFIGTDNKTVPENIAFQSQKVKELQTVTVKGIKSVRKELDDKYTGGAFSEPSIYSFDVRTEKRYKDLGSYLRSQLPGFQGGYNPFDPPSIPGHPLLFYVDEQQMTWSELGSYWFTEIAYIKAFESDFIGDDPFTKWKAKVGGFSSGDTSMKLKIPVQLSTMIIAIYTRKGTDIRTGWAGLNEMKITGYSQIAKWKNNSDDRLTLYWEPLQRGNDFRIKFYNNQITKHFRVVIEGFNQEGRLVHFEKILPGKGIRD